MNILFLGYWGASEGLSVSTIYPHLETLSSFDEIENIFYCSIERNGQLRPLTFNSRKIIHMPLSSPSKLGLLAKGFDFSYFPWKLSRLIEKEKIHFLICRGAPAGIIGHLLHKMCGVAYAVESFEPHADYMLESGVWEKYDPRYLIERWGEKAQKKTAAFLLPVAEGYAEWLKKNEAVKPDKLITLPCTVNLNEFTFSMTQRKAIRERLGISQHSICGIYVGKFGGLYYREEAFQIFKQAFSVVPNFELVILSPQQKHEILQSSTFLQDQLEKVHILSVGHTEVSAYLSAADFAFALYLPTPSKRFLSPIKVGEYWANGLPVIIPDGIGDETSIIKENPIAGLVFNSLEGIDWQYVLKLSSGNTRAAISGLAEEFRSRSRVREAYKEMFARVCFSTMENNISLTQT